MVQLLDKVCDIIAAYRDGKTFDEMAEKILEVMFEVRAMRRDPSHHIRELLKYGDEETRREVLRVATMDFCANILGCMSDNPDCPCDKWGYY